MSGGSRGATARSWCRGSASRPSIAIAARNRAARSGSELALRAAMTSSIFTRAALLGAFALTLSLYACGGGADVEVAVPEGGSRPSDGANGVCCPASAGFAHSRMGGYAEDPSACVEQYDNMCNARIVAGEHGCQKVVYDACPPGANMGGARFDGGPDADAGLD